MRTIYTIILSYHIAKYTHTHIDVNLYLFHLFDYNSFLFVATCLVEFPVNFF